MTHLRAVIAVLAGRLVEISSLHDCGRFLPLHYREISFV